MLLFQDPSEFSELDQVEERANPSMASVGAPLATTVVLGAIAFGLSASVIVAGAVAALPAYSLWKKLGKKMKNDIFLRRNPGSIAHLIKKDQDMIAWVEAHGKDDVLAQLLLAKKQGQKLTGCASRMLKSLVPSDALPPKKVEDFLARIPEGESGKQPTPATGGNTATPSADGRSVPYGVTMPNPASDEAPYVPGAGGAFNPATGKGSVLLDQVLQSPGISRLVLGGQRTGKSYFCAVASRELAKQGWKFFHINLASYGDEDSYYWQYAHRSVVGDLATIQDDDQARDLIDDALDCIKEFIVTEKSILIADEVSITGSKYGKHDASAYIRLLAEQISALTSTGTKRKRAIWALCSELRAGAMKDAVKAIKSLRLLYFAIVPGRFVEWQGEKITFGEELHQQIVDNFKSTTKPTNEQVSLCRRHGIDRLAYINGEWMPVGDLPVIEKVETPIPGEWEAIGQAMMATAGAVTYDRPGKINSAGVKQSDRGYLLQLIKDLKTSSIALRQKELILERGAQLEAGSGVGAAIEYLEQQLGI